MVSYISLVAFAGSYISLVAFIFSLLVKESLCMYCGLALFSNNDKGGVLVHFWMIFVVPMIKTPAVCEECVSAILRDSVLTSLKNRSSVGFLLGLPVDIDSIFINSKTSDTKGCDYTFS